jgi:hypothetical protein
MVFPIIIALFFVGIALLFSKEDEMLRDTEIDCSKVDVRECEFGLGCFANRNIRSGEVIEIGVMMPMPGVDGNKYEHLFSWSDNKELFASGSGCLPFYNHSDEPNIVKIGDLKANRMKIVALRDIQEGEELRNRYISKAWRGCFQTF